MIFYAGSADIPSASRPQREVLTKCQRKLYRLILPRFALNADETSALPVNRRLDVTFPARLSVSTR